MDRAAIAQDLADRVAHCTGNAEAKNRVERSRIGYATQRTYTVTGELLEMTRLADLKLDMPTFHPLRDGLPNRAVFGTAGVRPDGL